MYKLENNYDFYLTPDGEIDLIHYGQFRMGLSESEIRDYLRARANKTNIKTLYKKFIEIAGCNTMAVFTCPECKKQISLMYHHDVKRFADVLFGKTKSTYFD